MINYDTDRGVIVTKDKTGSTMSLKNASSGDSGNYTCVPYNIRAASVLVHVLSEGNSAAQLSNSAVSGQRGRLKRAYRIVASRSTCYYSENQIFVFQILEY